MESIISVLKQVELDNGKIEVLQNRLGHWYHLITLDEPLDVNKITLLSSYNVERFGIHHASIDNVNFYCGDEDDLIVITGEVRSTPIIYHNEFDISYLSPVFNRVNHILTSFNTYSFRSVFDMHARDLRNKID